MEETIDKKIERLLDNEEIKEIIATAGKGEVAPVTRASNLIGEVYTYCFVHNDGEDHHILCVFDQLYGGEQGVYGNPTHTGVTVVYNNK